MPQILMTFNSFQDLYTRDEIRLLADVKETGNPIIFPILLRAPKQFGLSWNSGAHEETVTLRLYYAMQVWAAAYGKVSDKSSYFDPPNNYTWENWNESFRIVRFTKPNLKEMLSAFWKELERIANSGEIEVSEGRFWRIDKKETWHTEKDSHNKRFECLAVIRTVVDAPDVTRAREQIRERCNAPENKTSAKTYSWGEIKGFFVELSEKMISFLDKDRMRRYEKSDILLFNACEKLDLEGVKNAVANGANVNALDEGGGSAMTRCCDAILDIFYRETGEDCPCRDLEYTTPENTAIIEKYTAVAFSIISFLLENGANIDLSDGEESTPLHQSHYFPNSKLMRFLLEHGANPNVNCFYADSGREWHIASSTLSGVWKEQACFGESRRLIEMERLLLEYGARIYIDGFVLEKEYPWTSAGEEEPPPPSILIQRIANFSELDKRLYIACAKVRVGLILDTLSAGANINLRDDEGRNLPAVAIEFGSQIGAVAHKAYYEGKRADFPLYENSDHYFEEELLTVVICLFGQKIQLTSEDLSHAIHLARQHGYTKVAAWLVEKQTRS